MEFEPLVFAREELVPLLEALCLLVESELEEEQRDFFARILAGIENASAAEDLADPFMQLSMSAFVGFSYSAPAALLIDRVLEKAHLLSETLSLDPSEIQ